MKGKERDEQGRKKKRGKLKAVGDKEWRLLKKNGLAENIFTKIIVIV